MTGRPKDSPAFWATDDVFDAPTESWDGTPTKGQPSTGAKEQGFHPSQRPPAEYLNWLWNNWSVHLQYLDGIQAKNWRRSSFVLDTEWDLTGEEKCICWDPVNYMYFITGPKFGGAVGGKVYLSANGQDWFDSGFVSTDESSGIMCSDTGYTVDVLISNRIHRHAPTADGATWTNIDVATCTSFHGGEWDPYLSVFWFIGKGTDTHPGIWSSLDTVAAVTKRTLGTPGSGAGDMKLIACGDNAGVAGGDWDNGAGNVPSVWQRSGDVTQTWTRVGSMNAIFGGAVMAFSYDKENGYFLATISDGSFWISSDEGVTWNQQKVPDAGWVPFPYCLAAYGSLYMAVALNVTLGSTMFSLWVSTDIGVTWSHVQWPSSIPDDEPRTLVLGDGEFVLVTQGQPGDNRPAKAAFSLKL